jgi:uncharacterized lipoprotein NlpE involved in copper resistance
MMSKVTINSSDRSHAKTEAAIYAEGTPFTSDELFAEWVATCEAEGELVSSQRVYEETLRNHPRFEESWL